MITDNKFSGFEAINGAKQHACRLCRWGALNISNNGKNYRCTKLAKKISSNANFDNTCIDFEQI